MNRIIYFLNCLFFVSHFCLASSPDSSKVAKHFIRPAIYMNTFGTGKQKLKKAKSTEYQFSQTNIGAYFPLLTKVKYNRKNMQSSFQIIGFTNILSSRPRLNIIENNHRLTRINIGCNNIFTAGKNTFLFTLSPFKAQDKSSIKTSTWRLSWMIVYNRTVNENFSIRIGYVKSFVLEGNPNLPLIGFRLGRYDAVHLNAQFPRNVSLTLPLNDKFSFSVYGKVLGSIYDFRDLEISTVAYDKVVFRRNDLQRGFEFNYKSKKQLNFFFGMGITTGSVSFAEKNGFNFSKNHVSIVSGQLTRAPFVNFGFQYCFGNAKKIYNNLAMQDALFLNQQNTNSDINSNGNFNSTDKVSKEMQLKNVQIKDIEDMIDVDDLN